MTNQEAINILSGLATHYNAFSEESEAICKAMSVLDFGAIEEPCADCVSREEAIKPFLVDATEEWTSADIVKYLKSLPPVTPAPRIGRWKQYNGSWYECSECGAVREAVGFFENYCPNCGSKMEVEE